MWATDWYTMRGMQNPMSTIHSSSDSLGSGGPPPNISAQLRTNPNINTTDASGKSKSPATKREQSPDEDGFLTPDEQSKSADQSRRPSRPKVETDNPLETIVSGDSASQSSSVPTSAVPSVGIQINMYKSAQRSRYLVWWMTSYMVQTTY